MQAVQRQLAQSPVKARVLPFIVFLLLTFLQGSFGEASTYWMYAVKTAVGAWLIWLMRPYVAEMKWVLSPAAIGVGVGVFVLWVGLDGAYPHTDALFAKVGLGKAKTAAEIEAAAWNPPAFFGGGSALALFFIGIRIVGSSLVVPPLEEVFFRSFLYRFIAKPHFEQVPLGQFLWTPFLVTALFFGFEHQQWLAGILCGFAYQGLVCWKKRLGDAITAHAITNLLLGIHVVYRGAWQFW